MNCLRSLALLLFAVLLLASPSRAVAGEEAPLRGSCVPSETVLCLLNDRFSVEVA